MNVSTVAGLLGVAAVPAAPMKLGFNEWFIFVCTLAIIFLSFGIKAARGKAKGKVDFMQRAGQGGMKRDARASGTDAAQDHDGALENDHEHEKEEL